MRKKIDPKELGLPARSVVERVDSHTLALVMDRKSRIIMADGRKILDRAEKIRRVRPGTEVIVKTSAPVCSKTLSLLKAAGIAVMPLEIRNLRP